MIFYFSATGNSKYVAEHLASATEDKLYALPDLVQGLNYQFDVSRELRIGFVVPTYFCGLPSILSFFIEKLKFYGYENQYVYLVLTCGKITGGAAGQLGRLLKKKGIDLAAQFAIPMVDNYIPMLKLPPEEKIKEQLQAAEDYLAEARRVIRSMGRGDYNRCQGIAPAVATATTYPIYAHGRATKHFVVTDTCTGCGQCAERCPCQAITLTEGKPKWSKSQCVHCLGCLHRCPAGAIHWKKASEQNGRYCNPNTKP